MKVDKDFLNWIKPCFCKILVCQKGLGYPVYKLKSGHHKRIRIDFLGKNKNNIWIAIEFEDGDTFGNITKGVVQLEDFYNSLLQGARIFTDDDIEIKPKYFLLATQYSKDGYLYKNDKRIIQTSGYSEGEILKQNNYTAFCLTRMMWRMCARNPYSSTNPVGVSKFGIIQKDYYGKPCVEINGMYKYTLDNLK